MLAVFCDVTLLVVTVKTALVEFAGTITLAGTWALALSLLSATEMPPVGAATFRVTVPCEFVPPTTLTGLSVSELTFVCGKTVNVAVCDVPL